jgi:hypothetical protein
MGKSSQGMRSPWQRMRSLGGNGREVGAQSKRGLDEFGAEDGAGGQAD